MAHKTKFKSRRGVGATKHENDKASCGIGDKELTAAKADVPLQPGSIRTAERAMPWVVGIIALLVYMGTMSPGMQMGDGTELATAASVLGVPHPTGYPLYMIVCKLWLFITVGGEVITRTTLLNCLFMAGAAGLTSVIIKDVLRTVWRTEVSKPLLMVASLAALLTAFLRFHWENAIVTEVYALQFLLTVIFVRIVQKMDIAGGPTRRGLIWLTVVFALALAHHRLAVTLVLPWTGVWIWAWRKGLTQNAVKSGSGVPPLEGHQGSRSGKVALQRWDTAATLRLSPKLVGTCLLIVVTGLSLYLYIPVRAAQHPAVNWGNATSWSAFYNHVRGTEYLDRGLLKPGLGQEFSGSSARQFFVLQTRQILGDLAGQLASGKETLVPGPPGSQKVFILLNYAAPFWGLVILAGSLWGFFCAWKAGSRGVAIITALIAAQNLAILYVYNIADIRDYYLFPFWASIVGVFFFNPKNQSYKFQQFKARIGLYCMSAMVLIIAALNYSRCDRSNDLSAELLSATILPESTDVMPVGSILITDDDAETFTTWYRQIVRGDRPDVLNFAGNFVYMPWYSAFFTAEQLRDFQITLAPHVARSAGEYAQQLRTAIIDKNAAAHPVFTSINDPAVLTILSNDYEIKPVDAVEVVNPLYDTPTTHVLYRLSPK